MNKTTRDIMEFCKCDAEWATKIQTKMAENGIDFSECTKSELRRARTVLLTSLR